MLKLIGYILGKQVANEKAHKDFLTFVNAMESHQLASVNLNESDRKQLTELKRRRALLSGDKDENT